MGSDSVTCHPAEATFPFYACMYALLCADSAPVVITIAVASGVILTVIAVGVFVLHARSQPTSRLSPCVRRVR